MAKISPTTFYNWNDGETIKAVDYKQEREIFRVAINENHQQFLTAEAEIKVARDEVNQTLPIVEEKANTAELNGIYAKNQGDYAKLKGDEADLKATSANQQALYAKEQGDYAKEQGDRAKDLVDSGGVTQLEFNAHLTNYSQFKENTENVIGISELQTTSQTLKGAINEVFQAGNSRKQQLVDMLLSLDASLPISYQSTWEEILIEAENISTGKKWASGTSTSFSISPGFSFTYPDGSKIARPYIEVTGLDFTPSAILINSTTSNNFTVLFPYNLWANNTNEIRVLEYSAYSTLNVVSSGITARSYRIIDMLFANGFKLPTVTQNTVYSWIAFE